MFSAIKNRFSRSRDPMGASTPGLDFLPDGYAERRRIRRTNAFCLLLFVVVVSAVGATFHVTEKSLAEVEAEYKQVNDAYTGAARQIEQVKQMLQKRKTVADRVELAVSLREKLPRSNVLAEMTNSLPPGVSLTDAVLEAKRILAPVPQKTSFEQKSGAGQSNDAPPQPLAFDTKLLLTGISYTEGQVSDYIDSLNRSGYFKAVDLKWVRKGNSMDKTDEAVRTFALSIELDPGAEAMTPERRRALRPMPRTGATASSDPSAVPAD